jgi:hypothetical protein
MSRRGGGSCLRATTTRAVWFLPGWGKQGATRCRFQFSALSGGFGNRTDLAG